MTIQHSSVDESGNSPEAQATSRGHSYDESGKSGRANSHTIPTSKTDDKKQAIGSNKERRYARRMNWTPSYRPFVIQLGSVKTFEQVTRAVAGYTLKGLDIHWDWVDSKEKGRWYRIFAGHFESKAEALKAKREHHLKNSLVRFNPWTVLVGQYSDSNILAAMRSLLLENQFDSLIVDTAEEIKWLLTGAYATRQGAEKVAKELQKLECPAQVVPR